MSVLSVGLNLGNNAYPQTGTSQQQGAAPSSSNVNTASTATQSTTAAASQSSTEVVTLSPEANAYAALASQGIAVTQVTIAGLGQSSSQGSSAATMIGDLKEMGAAVVNVPVDADGNPDGEITQAAFSKVVGQFGGTKQQADQLFAALDTNGSGSLSNAEVLQGLASVSTDSSSSTAQSLLSLMNYGNSGTSVNQAGFLAFETALIAAETPSQASS